ncbi:ATP-binding protein [Allochromatium tepidum]|uniref:histidine kinase n=1 Tax=Allochromatium tepidum TaxID=553982 RepID=A0ABM7QK22_9GAMM|nr:hypothetical protein Atep_07810 [Allochromatium tepidum]
MKPPFGNRPPAARPSWRSLLLLPVVTLAILAIGGYTFQSFREVIRNNTDQNLSAIAEQKRQQIEHLLTETRRDVEAFATGNSQLPDRLERWIAGGRRDGVLLDQMQGRTREMADIKDWLGAAVFDNDGRELFRVGTVESGPDRDLLVEVRARPEIRFIDLRANRAGVWEYSYLTPIRFRDGPVVGAFYVTLALERRLLPLVQSWPLPSETAESFLIRRSGMEIEYLTPLRHPSVAATQRHGSLDAPRLPAAWALQGRHGILRGGLDYRGEPVLAYAAPIAGTSWVMITKIDEREALAAIDTILWATSLVLAVVLLLTYAIGFLLWRREYQRRVLVALEFRHAIEERESELRAAHEAAARFDSDQRLGALIEQGLTGVAEIDRSGRFRRVNERYARIIGLPRATLLDRTLWDLILPEDRHRLQSTLDHLCHGGPPEIFERAIQRPNGERGYISASLAALKDAAGECIGFIALVTDITERKRMEEELRAREQSFRELNADLERQVAARTAEARAASAAKSEFLAHMSHEIRTPLNAVLGLTQLLALEPLPAEQHELVEHIQEAGQSLLALLNDILDFSKIEAGQLRLESQPFELAGILAKVDSLMLSTARSRGLTLSIETPDEPIGPLLGDALRIDQVLLNLIGNAIKFTERGDVRLRIRTIESGERRVRLRFEVSDSGIGIEPQILDQIFQSFTQANSGITRRFGGTGLGLSISKRLVELMGGRIGVESQVGRGSTFWFELPFERAATDAVAPPSPPSRPATGPRLAGRHFLVVDDSAMNREVVERALGREGARVTLAVDGQQALQTLMAGPHGFDAVLMDVRMPVMDGLTATRLIRDRLGLTDLPIIALTAGVMAEEQAAARAAGVDDILPKPLDLERLTECVLARLGAGAPVEGAVATEGGPAESVGVSLPDIPGLDRALAARSLGPDPVFFRRLLARFVAEQRDAVERTREALAAGAPEAATHAMHRLRGEAGHLGAVDLMRLAERLEPAIEQGTPEDALDADLRALEQRLADFIALSTPWIKETTAESAADATPAPAPDLDPERLDELRAALSENNSRARRIFKTLEPALRARFGTAASASLEAAIRDLRFDEALAVLRDAGPDH